MRDIKFRAWVRQQNKMLPPATIPEICKSYSMPLYWAEMMQFTGLRDKNGKEIFDGDIVKIDWKDSRYNPVISVVKWDEQEAAFDFGGGTASEVSWSHEVIGNIYESPELLTK
jgi:hypothetical protein